MVILSPENEVLSVTLKPLAQLSAHVLVENGKPLQDYQARLQFNTKVRGLTDLFSRLLPQAVSDEKGLLQFKNVVPGMKVNIVEARAGRSGYRSRLSFREIDLKPGAERYLGVFQVTKLAERGSQ